MSEPSERERVDKLTRDLAAGTIKVPGLNIPPKSAGKKVPTVYKHTVKIEWFRKFTLIERIKIALGCNFVIMEGIATQHNPGEWQPLIMGLVTKQKNASDHMRNVVENMLIEKQQSPESEQAERNVTGGREVKK